MLWKKKHYFIQILLFTNHINTSNTSPLEIQTPEIITIDSMMQPDQLVSLKNWRSGKPAVPQRWMVKYSGFFHFIVHWQFFHGTIHLIPHRRIPRNKVVILEAQFPCVDQWSWGSLCFELMFLVENTWITKTSYTFGFWWRWNIWFWYRCFFVKAIVLMQRGVFCYRIGFWTCWGF